MRYMLLIYGDERAWASASPEEHEKGFHDYDKHTKWLADKGWMQGGDPLASTGQATTFECRDRRP